MQPIYTIASSKKAMLSVCVELFCVYPKRDLGVALN